MIKKILLVVILTLSLSGCNDEGTTSGGVEETKQLNQEEILEIFTNAGNQDFLDIGVEVDMSISAAESMNMEVTTVSSTKLDMSDKENIQFYSNTTTDLMTNEFVTEMYYFDGYIFVETFGQKMKIAENFENVVDLSDYQMDIMSENLLSNVVISEEAGNTVLTYEITGDDFSEVFAQLGAMSGLEELTTVEEILVDQMKGSYVLDASHNPLQQHLEMQISTVVDGQLATIKMNMEITYHNYGEKVVVPVPENVEEYIEY